jgi:hypothetical protein
VSQRDCSHKHRHVQVQQRQSYWIAVQVIRSHSDQLDLLHFLSHAELGSTRGVGSSSWGKSSQ